MTTSKGGASADARNKLIKWADSILQSNDEQDLLDIPLTRKGKGIHPYYLMNLLGVDKSTLFTHSDVLSPVMAKIISADCYYQLKRIQRTSPARDALVQWAESIMQSTDDKELLEIEFTLDGKGGISIASYLCNKLGISRGSIRDHYDVILPVIEKIQNSDFYHKEYRVVANNYRRMMYAYYLNADKSQFEGITARSFSLHLTKLMGLQVGSLSQHAKRLICLTGNEMKADLIANKILKQPRNNSPVEGLSVISAKKQESDELVELLWALPLNNLSDVLQPTEDDIYLPFRQIFYSFSFKEGYSPAKVRSDFKVKIESYLAYCHGGDDVDFIGFFDSFALVRYHQWVKERVQLGVEEAGGISPTTGNGWLTSFRHLLRKAKKINGLGFEHYHNVSWFGANRATDMAKPFPDEVRTDLIDAIDNEIAAVNERTYVYESPKRPVNAVNPVVNGKLKVELVTEDNLQALLEEEMNTGFVLRNYLSSELFSAGCKELANKVSSPYFSGAETKQALLKRWGVMENVGLDEIYPYILKLARVTGMNSTPLMDLEIDDFVECHPISKKPALYYWKNRSTGGKILYLDLFDAEIKWLTLSQGKQVKKTFDDVKRLTAGLRPFAEEDVKKRLFIFRNQRSIDVIDVKRVNDVTLKRAATAFVKKWNLLDDGNPLQLNISRFRPTLVSELIKADVFLREIQLILGHKSIKTTIKYLDSHDFDSIAAKKVHQALIDVHESNIKNKSKATKQKEVNIPVKNIPSVPTLLAECKNILNPPDFIKQLPGYVEGKSCSLFNKCLGCDNVLLTRNHLPELFALRREYSTLVKQTHIMNTPMHRVIVDNLELLNEFLDVKTSDFDEAELAEGERFSWQVVIKNGAGL